MVSVLSDAYSYLALSIISPSCWEGINLPGLINNLAITRIPFAPPDTVRAEILKETLSRKEMSPKAISATVYGLTVPETRRKLRQAIGRGIRRLHGLDR